MSIKDYCQSFESLNTAFLPYDWTALTPHITPNTLYFHFEKHHKGYETNLKNLLTDDYKNLSLKEIVIKADQEKHTGIFNNAAQVWNHNFYWHSMSAHGGNLDESSDLANMLKRDFISFDAFKIAFIDGGKTQFGSGWVWLVYNKMSKKLEILKTGNAFTPITDANLYPLLTCDVWEHAYYLDYQNRRPDYLETFMKHLINWDFAICRLSHLENK